MSRFSFHRGWKTRKGVTFAIAFSLCLATAAAQDVTLTFKEGGLTISGEIVASDAASYVIRSQKYGVMAVETAKFTCSGNLCPKPTIQRIGIHGSNTIGGQLMPSVIEAYADGHGLSIERVVGADPEEVLLKLIAKDKTAAGNIDLHSHGTGTGPTGLAQGKAEIGMMSRPMKPEEAKPILDAGLKIKTNIFALDGLIVFVSPENPVKALTLEQIARIFAGEIKDWKDVGGAPGKINVYARDNKSGTFDTFDSLVLRANKLKISPEAKRFESSTDLSDETARDKNGIGFAGFAYLRNARALNIASACGITSTAEEFLVKTEEYPLSRRLYLYTTSAPLPPLSEKILNYALSDEAQPAIAAAGFINQTIDVQPFSAQANRLAPALMTADEDFNIAYMRQMIVDLKEAQRLSISFRFQKNSALLDDKAQQDISRLARFLTSSKLKPKEVILAGFTDSVGPFDGNRVIAFNRANGIKTALAAAGAGAPALNISVKAYGELLPVGCNTTEAGRDLNRRVEVWIKK